MSEGASGRINVLFVCLGNICRSPLAEVVFRDLTQRRSDARHLDFCIESCGTGDWHAGEPAHHQTRAVARRYGHDAENHRARQIKRGDFERFDLIVAMDRKNLASLEALLERGKKQRARLVLFRSYDPHRSSAQEEMEIDVPDPYFGGEEGFEEVYQIVRRCSERLLEEILGEFGSKNQRHEAQATNPVETSLFREAKGDSNSQSISQDPGVKGKTKEEVF